MASARFDLSALFDAIDAERRGKGLSWTALARQVGVSVSTMRRYADASDAEADGVLALVRWVGVAPESFHLDGRVNGTRLAVSSDSYIRVDMDPVRSTPLGRDVPRDRTRTTIQALVGLADRMNRPVASFTRLSHT